MKLYNERFKDAPWYKDCTKENVLIGGCGGIGGNALYCLTKSIPCNYWIIDPDKVEEINIGSQFFFPGDVGMYKVGSLFGRLCGFTSVKTFARKIDSNDKFPITISAFDNMEARKLLFNNWKSQENREIYLDGRLRATFYEIFVVRKGDEESYEMTLFDDAEVKEDMCTFKQTSFFGMLIGARITQVLTNYLTNKYSGQDICNIPYHIQELGEPFLINIEYHDN
jgi:molybdopterin/thiamine biosynthesis adenylyltransferase